MVRSPCTLLWPRTGQTPAPGLPMLPRSMRKLTISRMVGTPCLCWVSPIAQQTMIVLAARTRSPTSSISSRVSPVASRMSSQVTLRACSAKSSKPVVCVVDEVVVQHRAGVGVLGLQEQQVQRLEEGEVAAGPDLQELVGDGGAAADDSAGLLRVLEPHQAGLGQRVDGDDVAAVALGLLQRGEHARVVGARVLAHDEDQVGVVDVVEAHVALADAQGLRERGAAGLVAHVAAVGQVVGAVGAGEELEEERGLVVEPARGVEEGLVGGVELAQFLGEQAERLVPADRLVVVRAGPLDHGFGQPALLVEPVVGLLRPARRSGCSRKKSAVTRREVASSLMCLAPFSQYSFMWPVARRGFGPGAAGAVDALGLVDVQQGQRRAADRGLAQRVLERVRDRGQSGRPGLGRGDLQGSSSGSSMVLMIWPVPFCHPGHAPIRPGKRRTVAGSCGRRGPCSLCSIRLQDLHPDAGVNQNYAASALMGEGCERSRSIVLIG